MQTFLDDVAKKIIASEYAIDQVKIIVPSIRAISFLKESLKKVINRPIVAPEIISISAFIEELSGIESLSKLDLLYAFYEVYKGHTPPSALESFNQFFGWAPTLLQEFNEIDTQLVDTEALFSFMNALGTIEKWGDQEKGDLSKRHFKFQAQVPAYYNALYENLVKRQKAYSGIQLREGVKNLAFYLEQELPHHFFVGFNVLTKAEETIIQELIAEEKAEMIWDIDKDFYEDSFHSAGHFIRQYHKQWKGLKQADKPEFQELFSGPKVIEIISTAKNSIQSKAAVQIAADCYQENPNSSTAIVLGDESLLQPTLSVLPEKGMPWNVTMGYPLKETTLSSFFILYFEMQESYSKQGYPFGKLYEFYKTPSCNELLKNSKSEINQWIEQSNQNYIPSKALCEKGEIERLLFTPYRDVNSFLLQLTDIAKAVKNTYQKARRQTDQIHVSSRFVSLLESLLERYQKFNFIKSLGDIKMVFESLTNEQTFDFRGDALRGIQIMGILETRLLDFDHVIITNVNEGILPLGKTPFSWIPFDVRKKFKMNTFIEQDHLYAYHFFRLLQRAKKIFLLYNSTSDGLFSGERSRFLVQLEYFKQPQHKLILKQLELPISKLNPPLKKALKTQSVLDHLVRIGQEGFSPSSLTQYIRNPYGFYEQRMLKIRPAMEINKQLSASDKGTLMHEVLESLYKPYIMVLMKSDFYDEMLEKLPHTLVEKFKKASKNKEIRTGKNGLVYQVMYEVLKQFLHSEKQGVKAGDQIKILALEHQFITPIFIQNLNKNINFKGTVDRIDLYNNTLRFVDYKTGNVTAADLAFTIWEEVRMNPKKSALFQVIMYAYVLKNEFKNQTIVAGVIPLKTFNNDFLPASQKENSRKKNTLAINESVFFEFEKELFLLISEIFDPKTPFQETNS